MFKVGKDYKIRMNDGEGESSFNATLLRADLPLIVVEHGGGELIINTGSLGFVSAERDDEEIRAAKLAKHNEWLDSLDRENDDDASLTEQAANLPLEIIPTNDPER